MREKQVPPDEGKNMSELKKYHVLVNQEEAQTFEVWAHSPEEAEEAVMDGNDYENEPWYIEPELIGSMHLDSLIVEVTELKDEGEQA